MRLAEYLAREKIRPSQFARMVRVSAPMMHRLIKGERKPSWDVAVRIETLTNGEVRCNELGPEVAAS